MNIAIVGRAGVFPQSVDLTAFWQNIVHCRDMTSEVPDGRWRLDPNRVLNHSVEGTWSNRGGYVPEMDLVPSDVWMLDDSDIAGLDPLQSWVLHTAQGAITMVLDCLKRTGLILGNLSFPSSAMSAYVVQWFPNVSINRRIPIPIHVGTSRVVGQGFALVGRLGIGLCRLGWFHSFGL